MTWEYNYLPITALDDEVFGFVYLITNLLTNKKYVGKKQARFKKTAAPLKGQKRKRVTYVASDWQSYYGSNTQLNTDVWIYGEQCFSRQIIYFCKSKAELSYLETREIFLRNAIISDDYYNSFVGCKIHRKHLK